MQLLGIQLVRESHLILMIDRKDAKLKARAQERGRTSTVCSILFASRTLGYARLVERYDELHGSGDQSAAAFANVATFLSYYSGDLGDAIFIQPKDFVPGASFTLAWASNVSMISTNANTCAEALLVAVGISAGARESARFASDSAAFV